MSQIIVGITAPDEPIEEQLTKGIYLLREDNLKRLDENKQEKEPDVRLNVSISSSEETQLEQSAEEQKRTPLCIMSINKNSSLVTSRDGVHNVFQGENGYEENMIIQFGEILGLLNDTAQREKSIIDSTLEKRVNDFIAAKDHKLGTLHQISNNEYLLSLFIEKEVSYIGRMIRTEVELEPIGLFYLTLGFDNNRCSSKHLSYLGELPTGNIKTEKVNGKLIVTIPKKRVLDKYTIVKGEKEAVSLKRLGSSIVCGESGDLITNFDRFDDIVAVLLENHEANTYSLEIRNTTLDKDKGIEKFKSFIDNSDDAHELYRKPKCIKLYTHEGKHYCVVGCYEGDIFTIRYETIDNESLTADIITRNCFMSKRELFEEDYTSKKGAERFSIKRILANPKDSTRIMFCFAHYVFRVMFNELIEKQQDYYDSKEENSPKVQYKPLPHRITTFENI